MRRPISTALTCICLYCAFFLLTTEGLAQQVDRMAQLEQRLSDLSVELPGLAKRVTLSVSGASMQEFLRALAEAADLNISVDPSVDARIYNNFQSETARNILLFVAQEYHLDIGFIGTIISVRQLNPQDYRRPKPIMADYDKEHGRLTLSLENDSLVRVARAITERSGTNVIVTNELREKTVTLFVQQMELPAALRQLAFNNQLKLAETADGAFVFLPLGQREENFINSEAQPATRRLPLSVATDGGMGQGGSFYVEAQGTAPLLDIEANNTPIEEVVRYAADQVNANYFLFSPLQGTITTRLKQVSFDDLLTALLRGTAYAHKNENGIYLIGERRLEGLREMRVVQLQNRSIDTIQAMIPAEWRQGVEVKEFREQNTLLVAGPGPQVREIVDIVNRLDTRVPMVLIEVTMMDIRKGYNIKTGISAGVSDSVRTGGRVLPGVDYTFGAASINDFLSRIGTGSFNLGRVTPNFYLTLSALEDNNNVEMRSVPKLSTLNGHTASLSIGSTRYYRLSTQNVMGSLNPQTVVTEQYQDVNADMTINIRPIVSGDEQVTLNITIDISDFTQDTPIDEPPPSTTSKFESIIRVRNEETVVLGGIERFESANNSSGVPVLSRVPVLKWLFSSRSKSRNKIVSVVFIKPTIIYQ
ncbi:type IV pilus assembly protein PilQ [Parapedobacter composti]|uniref:Type IV pilus assembly protein PilQ n=1 Tax=Parapedobacter composti TaxID=623281 RepID=A0A1I1M386_9SPHI|nr:type IV pilus assembly protein PilQ [Parapedobacter composti]